MCLSQLQNKITSWNELQELLKTITLKGFPIKIIGINNGFKGFFWKEFVKRIESNVLLVLATEKEIESTLADVAMLGANPCILPSWQALPYTPLSINSPIFAERASSLIHLASVAESGTIDKKTVFITTIRALLTPVTPVSYIAGLKFCIEVGRDYDIEHISKRLVEWGYTKVPRVTVRGEFSVRGEVLDVAPIGNKADEHTAYRLVFNFDTVEKIRLFNITSQASLEELKKIELYSSKEVVWSDERISALEENLAKLQEFEGSYSAIIEELKTKRDFEGAELFFPLSFEKENSILSYLNAKKNFTVFYVESERLENAAPIISREYLALYKKTKQEAERRGAYDATPIVQPSPERILLSYENTVASYEKSVFLKSLKDEAPDSLANDSAASSTQELSTATNVSLLASLISSFSLNIAPERNFFGNIPYLKEELTSLIKEGNQVYIFADTPTQCLRIKEILKDLSVTVLPTSISSGFAIPHLKLLVIAEKEIFGRRRRVPKATKNVKSEVIDNFVELNPGDYVVHVNYGIGRFEGIERVKILDSERDYIKLQYANE